MFEDDNPLGLEYDNPPSIGEQLDAGVDLIRGLGNRISGAVTLIPEYLSQFRAANQQQAAQPVTPISGSTNVLQAAENLAQTQAITEAQAAEGVASRLESFVPKPVADAAALFTSVVMPGLGEVKLLPTLGTIRITKVGKLFPEVAEDASKYMDDADAYMAKHGSMHGFPRFVDPKGEEYIPRPKGTKPTGEPRLALSPRSGKEASAATRRGRDITSDSLEKFDRQQFNRMVKENKGDLMLQAGDIQTYVEHNRRLSSPYWNTARAKGQKPGNVDNLSELFDFEFKTFKDSVDAALDRIPDSPIDAFYDPMVDSIVVENIKTGKQLGYIEQGADIKAQLNKFIQKVK